MSEKKSSQSLSFSGGKVSQAQIGGMAGRDQSVTQTQQINQGETEKSLTQADVIRLFSQLEEVFRSSDLSEQQKAKAIKHLESAKEEAQEKDPDREFVAKNLQRATRVLKEAGETVEAGTSLWKKARPIITHLLPWLGVAASFFA
jgi:hypothetical protein